MGRLNDLQNTEKFLHGLERELESLMTAMRRAIRGEGAHC
jgi:hypothetical protein